MRPPGSKLSFPRIFPSCFLYPFATKVQEEGQALGGTALVHLTAAEAFLGIASPPPCQSKHGANILFHWYNQCCYRGETKSCTGLNTYRNKSHLSDRLGSCHSIPGESMKQASRRQWCRLFAEGLPFLSLVMHSSSICTHRDVLTMNMQCSFAN